MRLGELAAHKASPACTVFFRVECPLRLAGCPHECSIPRLNAGQLRDHLQSVARVADCFETLLERDRQKTALIEQQATQIAQLSAAALLSSPPTPRNAPTDSTTSAVTPTVTATPTSAVNTTSNSSSSSAGDKSEVSPVTSTSSATSELKLSQSHTARKLLTTPNALREQQKQQQLENAVEPKVYGKRGGISPAVLTTSSTAQSTDFNIVGGGKRQKVITLPLTTGAVLTRSGVVSSTSSADERSDDSSVLLWTRATTTLVPAAASAIVLVGNSSDAESDDVVYINTTSSVGAKRRFVTFNPDAHELSFDNTQPPDSTARMSSVARRTKAGHVYCNQDDVVTTTKVQRACRKSALNKDNTSAPYDEHIAATTTSNRAEKTAGAVQTKKRCGRKPKTDKVAEIDTAADADSSNTFGVSSEPRASPRGMQPRKLHPCDEDLMCSELF
eukprot:gene33863-41773_t